jgi:hypothetical protein
LVSSDIMLIRISKKNRQRNVLKIPKE